MTGQPHAAILLLLVMLMIGIAVAVRSGGEGARPHALSDDAWICASRLDNLECFLAGLTH